MAQIFKKSLWVLGTHLPWVSNFHGGWISCSFRLLWKSQLKVLKHTITIFKQVNFYCVYFKVTKSTTIKMYWARDNLRLCLHWEGSSVWKRDLNFSLTLHLLFSSIAGLYFSYYNLCKRIFPLELQKNTLHSYHFIGNTCCQN